MSLQGQRRQIGLALKFVLGIAGVMLMVYSILYIRNQLGYLVGKGGLDYGDIITLTGGIACLLSGIALAVLLPESLRVRSWRPLRKAIPKPVYGFGTVLAIGIGATLGSPLFILIPLNVVQYSVISVSSLIAAALLTFLVAKLYADMNTIAMRAGKNPVGGPSFVSIAVGSRSVRYFITRVSNWLANTTLAAYSALLFVLFDLQVLPGLLVQVGFSSLQSQMIVYGVDISFAAWFLINTVFERRFLRLIGVVQVFLTVVMMFILAYQSYLFGSVSSWNLSGFFASLGNNEWPVALLVNTAYLFLLFFGFQEIQSLYNDSIEDSKVPLLSFIRRGYTMGKMSYFRVTMLASVLIALAINVFYAISVYSLHPDLATIQASAIPGLFLAGKYLGSTQQLITALVFLIATFTTFVPTFMAASRHLSSLAEDGFLPHSLGRLSWVFTLVSIAVLVVGGQDFLVNITDFMMLISLGLVALAATWLRKGRTFPLGRGDAVSFITWLLCFISAGAIYLIEPSVVILGVAAIFFVHLIYDLIELGALGVQMMLISLNTIAILAISSLNMPSGLSSLYVPIISITIDHPNYLMLYALAGAATLLLVNLVADVKLLRRTAFAV
ncbi:MAG: hypothetical protein QXV32_01810 [Conexivisphaerales archaeon]